MPAMLSLSLEWGTLTRGSNALLALRMRVSMSEMGSFIGLPTGLGDAWDQPGQRGFAEGHSRAAELAQIAMAPAAHRATVHHSGRAGVARELRQPRIVLLRLEFRPQSGVLLDRLGLFLISFDPGYFCHTSKKPIYTNTNLKPALAPIFVLWALPWPCFQRRASPSASEIRARLRCCARSSQW